MLEAWLNGQKQQGNEEAVEEGKKLLEKFGDIPRDPRGFIFGPGWHLPLPRRLGTQNSLEQGPNLPEINRFSQEAREALEKEGYVIYALTGQSIRSQRNAGRKFGSTWHNDYRQFEALISMSSEVAINPSQLFIKDSNNKTQKQQEDLIAKFSRDLGKKVKGVGAVMGTAADYVDLAFAYLDVDGERLFGEKYDYNYARTKTPMPEGDVADVGRFNADHGLDVNYWYPDYGYSYVFAVPLVVPKA